MATDLATFVRAYRFVESREGAPVTFRILRQPPGKAGAFVAEFTTREGTCKGTGATEDDAIDSLVTHVRDSVGRTRRDLEGAIARNNEMLASLDWAK